MQSVEVSTRLSTSTASSVQRLIALAETFDGYRPVSDQFWIDLQRDTGDEVIRFCLWDPQHEFLVAYAQASTNASTSGASGSSSNDRPWSIEMVVRPDRRPELDGITRTLLATVSDSVRLRGGGALSWLVYAPAPTHNAIAAKFGLAPTRRLFQMTMPLPTGAAFDLKTRPFEPGRDEDAWLLVNRRAFAWNPEQGSWTLDSLRARLAEPWFDASGFLLHERAGRLAGFCWTKVHADSKPRMGEIYVIAVDPDFHGMGLGRDLTLAGLDHLANLGITIGMLFVDADNTAAVGLYEKLGFTVHRTDCVYRGQIA